eukprot:CAMPEP_0180328300 /NCGR_PEP_ID=MMETSP0988-20121125/40079_1 /TAXON_ID=697907 /ORGANISM="non described non described, Strain CCMP2293" /LENGTH=75 /DNA_ID=CAMNT_0022315177 /DNA_START=300 /DNA_END=523 /DNA_ORIENTATION=+
MREDPFQEFHHVQSVHGHAPVQQYRLSMREGCDSDFAHLGRPAPLRDVLVPLLLERREKSLIGDKATPGPEEPFP